MSLLHPIRGGGAANRLAQKRLNERHARERAAHAIMAANRSVNKRAVVNTIKLLVSTVAVIISIIGLILLQAGVVITAIVVGVLVAKTLIALVDAFMS